MCGSGTRQVTRFPLVHGDSGVGLVVGTPCVWRSSRFPYSGYLLGSTVRSRLQLVLFMRGLIENSTVWIAMDRNTSLRASCSSDVSWALESTEVSAVPAVMLSKRHQWQCTESPHLLSASCTPTCPFCDFGVPCDCSLKSTAFGQCEEERLFLDFEQLQTHHFRQFLVTFKLCRVTKPAACVAHARSC